jgi:hypothetical protein
MVKPSVEGPWVDKFGQAQLLNMAESLEVWVFDKLKNQFTANGNETIDRIIDDFWFLHARMS